MGRSRFTSGREQLAIKLILRCLVAFGEKNQKYVKGEISPPGPDMAGGLS